MQRKLLMAVMLLSALSMWAQTPVAGAEQAERIFGWVVRGQADSLYVHLTDEMKAALTREQLEGLWAQAEQMAGPYVGHGPWQEKATDSLRVYTSAVSFEHLKLNFILALGPGHENMVRGIHLGIAAEAPVAAPLPADAVELADTVRVGAGVALPCSVVLSGRTANPPIVVFVHGSGALDRDETVMGNKTFLDLSRQLAWRGIGSLRYDKRTFVYKTPVASMDEETICDALAALNLARTYGNDVYLLGHSLGAILAPTIASRDGGGLKGIVMMAGPARDLSEVIREQIDYLSDCSADAAEKAAAIERMHRQAPHYFEPQCQVQTAQRLHLPMLVLQGGRDYQVTTRDFQLWQRALAGRKEVDMRLYPELNHLFLPGEGRSTPQEYLQQASIPGQVVDDIASFVQKHSASQGNIPPNQ